MNPASQRTASNPIDDTLALVARPARSEKEKQRYRVGRYLQGLVSSLAVILLMAGMAAFGAMDWNGFFYTAVGVLLACAFFAALFILGINRRARDPSLTAQMMAASLVMLTVGMFFSTSEGRGLVLMIFLVSFIFGILRLQRRELLYTGLFASLLYGLMIAMLSLYRPDALELRLELLRWLVMSGVLVWFSIIGGHISRVRKQLYDNNQQLGKALETIRELASHDVLTGLCNRRYLEETLHHEKSQSERSGRGLCVCLVDIDLFKSINDTHGHEGGDTVLRGFASASRAITRKSDHFGRWGGEEFLAVLTCTDLAGAMVWAENLRKQTAGLTIHELSADFRFTISIGVAQYQAGEDITKTVARADRALYCAKTAGRNRIAAL